jgi:xylulokinase
MSNQETMLMAVDLGTSFIKVSVYDLSGICVTSSIAPVKDERPKPGIFLQRGDDLLDSVISAMRKVCEILGERAKWIEAIAFTGQMAGFMGVDGDWNDITTWSCSLDTRYVPYASRQLAEHKEAFINIGGSGGGPQMAPKYEWFKDEFPELDKKISKYIMISGYMLGRLGELSVEDAVMDVSFSTWTGLADVRKREWSDYLCEKVGIDKRRLPKIVNSNSVCTYLSKQMAEHIGLKAGIPLVSGAGDKVASCVGSCVLDPGDANFEASSYGAIHVCVSDFRADELYDCLPSPFEGEYYLTKYIAGSGITLDWYMSNFICKDGEKPEDAFVRIERDISRIPAGCGGLIGIGLLAGNVFPLDGTVRGMWMGFDWSHKPEHFHRALLESYAYDFSSTFERIIKNYPELNLQTVNALGGGAKSDTWMQIMADVTEMKYLKLSRKDTATWGAAMLAGNAIGVFPDIKAIARNTINVTGEYIPAEETRLVYKGYKEFYLKQLSQLKASYGQLEQLKYL